MTASVKTLKKVSKLFRQLGQVSESIQLNKFQKHIARELIWDKIGEHLDEHKDTV